MSFITVCVESNVTWFKKRAAKTHQYSLFSYCEHNVVFYSLCIQPDRTLLNALSQSSHILLLTQVCDCFMSGSAPLVFQLWRCSPGCLSSFCCDFHWSDIWCVMCTLLCLTCGWISIYNHLKSLGFFYFACQDFLFGWFPLNGFRCHKQLQLHVKGEEGTISPVGTVLKHSLQF